MKTSLIAHLPAYGMCVHNHSQCSINILWAELSSLPRRKIAGSPFVALLAARKADKIQIKITPKTTKTALYV